MKRFKSLRFIITFLILISAIVLARLIRGNYYMISADKVYEQSLDTDEIIPFNQYEISPEDFYLVDLSNEKLFQQWHVENAVNIPYMDLLNRISFKNKYQKWLIYSNNISETVKAKMILNQKGIKAFYLDFAEINNNVAYKNVNSIGLDEKFKYKFRPDSTIRPE
ncbi:MAG: hypothetical protein C0597_10915 [Marinilabiliales bacterium]|nr:MAG: hypothetical protein C0597_10915 [Marinilabiliales bacterium]